MSNDGAEVSNWMTFFKDAGIPSGLGANYAVIFCDHRIAKDILGDLNREILLDMGIKAMGDIIAILKQAKIVSEQVTRENTSKLIGIKASNKILKSKSQKPTTPDSPTSKSVFSRLGQDSPTAGETSGVFKRLGDPIVTTTTDPSYEGMLETPSTPMLPSTVKLTTKKVANSPALTKTTTSDTKQVGVKRKSVLDRLGPATVSPKKGRKSLEESSPKLENVIRLDTSSDSSDSSEEEEVKKTPKIIRLRPSSSTNLADLKSKKKVTVKKPATALVSNRKSNVLDRLGGRVTSTTPTRKSPVIRRTFPSKSNSVTLLTKKSVTPSRSNKVTSSKIRLRVPIGRKTATKPISSNLVSSTTSAGLFKGEASTSSSVFDRLGAK